MKITEDLVSLNVNKTSHHTTKTPNLHKSLFSSKKGLRLYRRQTHEKKIEKNQIRKENE